MIKKDSIMRGIAFFSLSLIIFFGGYVLDGGDLSDLFFLSSFLAVFLSTLFIVGISYSPSEIYNIIKFTVTPKEESKSRYLEAANFYRTFYKTVVLVGFVMSLMFFVAFLNGNTDNISSKQQSQLLSICLLPLFYGLILKLFVFKPTYHRLLDKMDSFK